MINFDDKASWQDVSAPDELKKELEYHRNKIETDLSDLGRNKFLLGTHLIDLYMSNAYAKDVKLKRIWAYDCTKAHFYWKETGGYWGNARACAFFDYCEAQFGLDKTQVSRLMNIVNEFGEKHIGFAKPWNEYRYSQLVEMLPLTSEQRLEVKPDWTIKRIREYKKTLVASSQQDGSSENRKSVATSQLGYDDECETFLFKPVVIPLSGDYRSYEVFDRFRGLSLQRILLDYLNLEKRYTELSAMLDIKGEKTK